LFNLTSSNVLVFLLCRGLVNIPYDKPCIILEGSNRGNTIISYGDKQTSTFISMPPNVILRGITFEVKQTHTHIYISKKISTN
jgi:hypothetical protein